MARKEIVLSDITGAEIEEARVARVVVSDHPALGNRTVELDASVDEVTNLESSRIELVSLGVYLPGHNSPRRLVMDVAGFNRLFGKRDVAEVLRSARAGGEAPGASGRGRRRSTATASGPKVDYTDQRHFGQLHRGRVTDEEASLVRSNLSQANKNRAAADQPPIDPSDPKEKKRYGL